MFRHERIQQPCIVSHRIVLHRLCRRRIFTQVSTASRRVIASRAMHVPSKSTRYQVPRIDLRGRSLGDVAQRERIPSSLSSRAVHIGE